MKIKRLVGAPSCGSMPLPSGPDLIQVEPFVLIVNSYIHQVTWAVPESSSDFSFSDWVIDDQHF